jgi:polyisoprenyl-teichoic acid--peptidoglycan teichoic acid transferase
MRAKIRRLYLPKIKFVITLICLFGVLFLIAEGLTVYGSFVKSSGLNLSTVVKLVIGRGAVLNQTDGRTNILILGIGGGNHEGPDLTDTMMVVSLNPAAKSMTLISVPRDIWSDTLQDKVNSAYHYGEAKKNGGGLTLAKVITEDIIGLPVHYGIVIDFSGFKNIIDLVGGIDVNVPIAFTDSQYPIAGRENDTCGGDPTFACRYQTVSFTAGPTHMDGDRALTYVRSRHAEGTEGSDFARSRRQQEVLLALKQKLVTASQLLNVRQDLALVKAVDNATDMDMTMGEFLTIGKIAGSVKSDKISRIAIDDLFISPPQSAYGGRFVLIPKDDPQSVYREVKAKLQ